MLKRLYGILPSAVFAGVLAVTPALAQSTGELRLTTSPLPINLHVTPGSSVSAALKIKNDGNQSETLKAVLMKFKADPVTGATVLADREPTDSYFDWVTFSDPTFALPSNEWKTVTATFSVPDTAAFDYYYAVVFLRADQGINPSGKTVLNGGTATLVLLTVDVPGAKKQLDLEKFSVDRNIFEFLPASFDVKIRNTGNVHVIPHGNIFISRDGGKDIAVLDVNATQGSTLPNAPRTFTTDWSDGFPVYVAEEDGNGIKQKDAKGNLIEELKWDWANASHLRFGKYTAKLLLVYDDGQRDVPIESQVTFWVIPWRLVGGGLVVLIFVLIGLKSTLSSWYRKARGFLGKGE